MVKPSFMRRFIFRSFQSPGDVLMLTAAVRDLHQAQPGQFQTDVRTSADALWQNNPYLTKFQEGAAGVETLDMHYPLVHQSNQRPYHFLHGYVQYLEQQLNLRIAVMIQKEELSRLVDWKNSLCPGESAHEGLSGHVMARWVQCYVERLVRIGQCARVGITGRTAGTTEDIYVLKVRRRRPLVSGQTRSRRRAPVARREHRQSIPCPTPSKPA